MGYDPNSSSSYFLKGIISGSAKLQPTLLKRLREDMEKEALLHAIHISNDNKNKAARLLESTERFI